MLSKEAQFQVSNIPDLKGYVAIVTGGNSGIGYETTLQLAKRNARVYIAARSESRVKEAIHSMQQSNAEAANYDLHFLPVDLQSFKSVRAAAEEFMKRETKLDLLINNAGVMSVPFALTEDGFELHWQTNHLSHHLLFTSLLPLLSSTAAGTTRDRVRVVNVSGDAYASGPSTLNLENPNMPSVYQPLAPWRRYAHSKLANIVHARAIHDRYRSSGISAFALHPGIIGTNLQKADPTMFGSFLRLGVRSGLIPGTMSIADGARTTLFCATSPDAPKWSGRYISPYGKVNRKVDRWIEDGEAVKGLWEASNSMVAPKVV